MCDWDEKGGKREGQVQDVNTFNSVRLKLKATKRH